MFLIAILVVIVGILNFFYLLPPVVNWDEGTHALWGFKEWLALRSGDWHLFWQLSRAQFSYPPLGSWLIALINLPFEFSLNLARFTSTLGFIIGGILLVLIAKKLSTGPVVRLVGRRFSAVSKDNSSKTYQLQRPPPANTLITLFFYLTSPAILFYSVTVFKESWGMALTLLTLYLYFRAITQKTAAAYFCVSLSLILLFFEKYNYTVLLGLVLGLEAVVEIVLLIAGSVKNSIMSLRVLKNSSNFLVRGNLFLSLERLLRRPDVTSGSPRNDKKYRWFLISQLALFLPLVLFGSWWIFTPDNKLAQFLDIMRSDWNPVTVGAGNSWQYLTFFVQSIRVSYVFSDVIFLVTVICYLLSVKDLWQKKIRVLWLFFTLNFVLGTLHSINLQDRYILTSVPILFLIVGYEGQKLTSFFLQHLRNTKLDFLARPRKSNGKEGRPSSSTVTLLICEEESFREFLHFVQSVPAFLSSLIKCYYVDFTKGTQTRYSKAVFTKGNRNWSLDIGYWILALVIGLLVILVFLDFIKLPQLLKSNATHMLLSPMYNETDYHDRLFDFNKNDWSHFVPPSGTSRDKPQDETPETVIDYILDNVDITKPINYLGWTSEISPDWVELRRQMALRKGQGNQGNQGNYLVTIEVKPISRLYTYDYKRANLWQLTKVKEIEQNDQDKLLKQKDFKQLGIVVKVYGL